MKKLLTLCLFATSSSLLTAQRSIESCFIEPPAEAKPIIIWQWMDGLLSTEGITADLEAYKAAGIGGVQQFQVGGPVQVAVSDSTNAIGTDAWQHLMQHAISECSRLGLSFGTHNCPGWSSSAYPTVRPEYSMQKLVWREDSIIIAPSRKKVAMIALPAQPEVDAQWNYYEDIVVLVMPAGGTVQATDIHVFQPSQFPIRWDGKSGPLRIIRFGHTTNGKTNHSTAPTGGVGLECDKMSREAVLHYWGSYPTLLMTLAGSETGKTFQRLEIDSYEAGGQEWTRLLPDEFLKRRGYNLLPWLPALVASTIIDSPEATQRVRREWQETVSDLFAENYYGYMSQLAHQHGLTLLVQPYGTGSAKPFNPVNTDKVVQRLAADDPISAEFWASPTNWGWKDIPRVVNAARRAGHEIVLAEGFTCVPSNAWKDDPNRLKALADSAFCLGINRLMLHAAAQNPWVNAKPGMTFGIWGTWWTPGQTWWKDGAKPLFTYFARCQALLQRGRFADDFHSKNPTLTADTPGLQWIHRTDGNADIYFIANTTYATLTPTIIISSEGRIPEVWNPETGAIAEAEAWLTADGKTQVKLQLPTRASAFIVMRKPLATAAPGLTLRQPVTAETIQLKGPWTLSFDGGKQIQWAELTPWNEATDPGIKYYSGTACYRQYFRLKKLDKNARYLLDLGEVKNLAVVCVNGKSCGTLWRAPFTTDITDALCKGDNTIDIEVTNLWVNRMVGDEFEPDDVEWAAPSNFGPASIGQSMKVVPEWLKQGLPRPSSGRKAIVSFKFFNKGTPLLRSGMMGPVIIRKTIH